MNSDIMNYLSIGMGLLIALLGIPMATGKIKPNRVYGFRTKRTLSSPDVWYPANRAAGICMIIAGGCLMVASAVIMVVWKNPPETPHAIVHLALWAVAIVWMTMASFRSLRRLGKQPPGA